MTNEQEVAKWLNMKATDEQVAKWRDGLSTDQFYLMDIPASLIARIAADAEIIKAERARADKYEAESEQKGADLMAAESIIAEQAEEIERLKAQVQVGHDVIRDFDAKIDEARAQVETLRAAAEMALDLTLKYARPGDDEGYVFSNRVTTKLRAALATTEPKG